MSVSALVCPTELDGVAYLTAVHSVAGNVARQPLVPPLPAGDVFVHDHLHVLFARVRLQTPLVGRTRRIPAWGDRCHPLCKWLFVDVNLFPVNVFPPEYSY